MTKQEIYEQIVRLTSELHSTGVAVKIFEAAETGEAKNVEEVFETFKNENSDLYQRIVSFGEKFNELMIENCLAVEIFGEEDKANGVFVFDTDTINALSLLVLTFFAKIDDCHLFEDWGYDSVSADNYLKAIAEPGYDDLADFVADYSWGDWVGEDEEQYPTLYDLLVVIIKGEFDEDSEDESEAELEEESDEETE